LSPSRCNCIDKAFVRTRPVNFTDNRTFSTGEKAEIGWPPAPHLTADTLVQDFKPAYLQPRRYAVSRQPTPSSRINRKAVAQSLDVLRHALSYGVVGAPLKHVGDQIVHVLDFSFSAAAGGDRREPKRNPEVTKGFSG
jgi:hypothetical protein